MDRYSAYGVPFGLPEGDSNSDGVANATDRTIIQGWINTSHYDVRGDADLDGDVDSTDKTNIGNLGTVTLGRGALSASAVGNSFGCSGNPTRLGNRVNEVRSRMLEIRLGAWMGRDPLVYIDAMSLYVASGSNPIIRNDPSGNSYTMTPGLTTTHGQLMAGCPEYAEMMSYLGSSATEGHEFKEGPVKEPNAGLTEYNGHNTNSNPTVSTIDNKGKKGVTPQMLVHEAVHAKQSQSHHEQNSCPEKRQDHDKWQKWMNDKDGGEKEAYAMQDLCCTRCPGLCDK